MLGHRAPTSQGLGQGAAMGVAWKSWGSGRLPGRGRREATTRKHGPASRQHRRHAWTVPSPSLESPADTTG